MDPKYPDSPLQTVRQVARLAGLEVEEQRLPALARDFDALIEAFADLVTAPENPADQPKPHCAVLRQDVPRDANDAPGWLGNEGTREGDFYSAPPTAPEADSPA